MFSKDCPQCGKDNPAYAVRCACGYLFSGPADGDQQEADQELTLQEEQLYAEYLAARAEQATAAAESAAKLAAAQPANLAKKKEAEGAKAAAERAEAELKSQRAQINVAAAGAAITATKPAAKQSVPQPQPAPNPTPAATKTAQPRAAANPAASPKAPPTPPEASKSVQPTAQSTKSAVAASRPAAPKSTSKQPQRAGTATQTTPDKKPGQSANADSLQKSAILARAAELAKSKADAGPANAAAQPNDPTAAVPKPLPNPAVATPTTAAVKSPAPSAKPAAAAPANRAKATASITKTSSPPTTEQPAKRRAADPTTGAAKPVGTLQAKATPDKPVRTQKSTKELVAAARATAAAHAKRLAATLKASVVGKANAPGPKLTGEKLPAETAKSGGQATKTVAPGSKPTPAPEANSRPSGSTETDVRVSHAVESDDTAPTKVNGMERPIPQGNTVLLEPAADKPDATALDHSASPQRPTPAAAPNASSHARTPQREAQSAPKPDDLTPQVELEAALAALESRAPNEAEASPTAPTAPQTTAATASQPQATPASQAQKPANTKDCPNCTAIIPMETRRCRCGFAFATAEESMPSLSLSDADVAALDGKVKSGGGITPLS
ncbi:MAG: hypothetical protein ACE5K1_04210 [Acidiferrobacterales bacterium]